MRFYYKKEIKIEQGYDKKMYPKLMLNRQKVIRNSTSILYLLGTDFKEASPKTFNLHVAYVHPCVPMCIHVNYE
jgi:hypothetical protein